MNKKPFPTGIADGEAFLGRDEEAYRLLDNIEHGRHTLLLSPRRYGKTSLAKHVIAKTKLPSVEIDLFLAIDEKSIETRIISGIETLIMSLSNEPAQWMKTLISFFTKANKKWTIGMTGLKLELKPEAYNNAADNILSILQALEHLLTKKKQKAIIFFDEFQEINKLSVSKAIEGAIRHFAQSAKQIVFIFSGSSRHLLMDMFGNSEKPLYDLCDWLILERIQVGLYERYLNKVSKKTWKQPLDTKAFTTIMNLTQRHPEVTYALCAALWQYCQYRNKFPSGRDVENTWQRLVKDKLKPTRIFLSNLSSGQLKILILIATDFNKPITGKDAQAKINLTSPSIVKAIEVLDKQDFIEYVDGTHYRVINPIIAATLKDYYTEY